MVRAKWKVPHLPLMFFSTFFASKRNLTMKKSSSVITMNLLNKSVSVYNGIWLLSLNIKSAMVGHKLGEFSISKSLGKDMHFKEKQSKK